MHTLFKVNGIEDLDPVSILQKSILWGIKKGGHGLLSDSMPP